MEKIEGGQVYIKSIPRCPVHGQMRMSRDVPPPKVLWVCAGWDGEGCGYEMGGAEIPWVRIGEIDSFAFTLLGSLRPKRAKAPKRHRARSSGAGPQPRCP